MNNPSSGAAPLSQVKVMLVDDSAIIRGALTRILESDPAIKVVNSVGNGEIAIKAAGQSLPDIVILDVEMPVMDGITALPQILTASPKSKVIMFSTLTDRGAEISLRALSLGAVECFPKPSSAQDVGKSSDFQDKLINTVKSLAGYRPQRHVQAPSAATATSNDLKTFNLNKNPSAYKNKPAIVAIGSSTGGPQALFEVIKHFKGFDVPIVITQHMPPKFTTMLAQHIQTNTGVTTHEGAEGMVIEKGHAYIAPGGLHMLIVREGTTLKVKLNDGPQENFCKPSVDPMYRSLIELFGEKVLGVILTGMGNDGLYGSKALIEKNGRLIAQDQQTSIVWGMPGAVAMAGLCSEVLPLKDIGPWVRKAVMG